MAALVPIASHSRWETPGLPSSMSNPASCGLTASLGHESFVNCDNLFTLPKEGLGRHRGALDPMQLSRLDDALRITLGLD